MFQYELKILARWSWYKEALSKDLSRITQSDLINGQKYYNPTF